MAVQTMAGTVLGISATLPTTYDAAGYGTLTFETIGEVTDPGEHGVEYAEVTHTPVATRIVKKYKGSIDLGTKSVQLAVDPDDAGQIIARAALDSDADYAFEQTYQDGSKDYFIGKVRNFRQGAGGTDSILSATMEIMLTSGPNGEGIIFVPAQ